VTALRGSGRVEAVETSEGVVPTDLVLVATGIRPNVELARAMGVALGPTGALATDERMRTNLEGVYAACDVAESFHQVLKRPYWLPLGDVANKHGRTAGAVIAGKEARFHEVAGTAIFKAFGLAMATTGLSLEATLKEGYAAKKVFHQEPGRRPLLPGGPASLCGAGLRGGDGKASRGRGGGLWPRSPAPRRPGGPSFQGRDVEDLLALDLAYAPPFSPVWDPLLIAAQQVR